MNGVNVWGYASGQELLDFLGSYSLTRAPGAEWEYSNLGFSLLGMAEEAVGLAAYETLIAEKITEPLALHDTRIVLTRAQKTRLAKGYRAGGAAAPIVASSGESLAAGALRSTIQDMALYLRENMSRMGTTLGGVLLMTQRPAAIGGNPNAMSGLGWNITASGNCETSASRRTVRRRDSPRISASLDRAKRDLSCCATDRMQARTWRHASMRRSASQGCRWRMALSSVIRIAELRPWSCSREA